MFFVLAVGGQLEVTGAFERVDQENHGVGWRGQDAEGSGQGK